MPIDPQRGMRYMESLEPRRAAVECQELPDNMFAKDSPDKVIHLRMLDGEEVQLCREAAERSQTRAKLYEMLAQDGGQQVEAAAELFGFSRKNVPEQISRFNQMLVFGIEDPKVGFDWVVQLCRCFPMTYFNLAHKLIELAKLGAEPGKSNGSGETPKSEPALR